MPMPTSAVDVSFDILDWTSVSGKFSSLQLPALTAPAGWSTTQLYTTGALIATLFVPGDVNRDGQVNVADIPAMMTALANLTAYQSTSSLTNPQLLLVADLTGDNLVTNSDIQGLSNLLANGGGSGSGSLTAVPEPASLVLLALGGAVALARIAGAKR